ncbi:MAG: FHA domain-containing serine/threonine-protein kinase [Planctomycetota bacterium]
MTARLTLVVVGEERAPIDLPVQGRLVLGSGERAHVQISGQGVADVHCTIGKVRGGGWALQDLGSEFGTLVNGAPAETHRLAAGDELVLGSRRVRIVDPAAPLATAPKPAANGSTPLAPPGPGKGHPAAPSGAASPPSAPASSAPMSPAPVPRTEPSDSERAPVLGGYRIDDRLGRGAMGTVYLATQTSLDRPVALKVLSPKLASDPRFVERFQAEARAAAALNHPNVVTVYDVGTDGPHHYLAMEYMDASSLEVSLEERGPLPWREVLTVLRDAASGLVYAEQRRIVHRDIKPENLMRNQEGVTKIADLGLAVQIEAESQDDDHLSEGRRIFGTPHFIAPECVRGEAADSRSDLYSLGATAYRLLSGHTPFEGATTREILRGVLNDPAPPLAELVPGLPEGVARLVHRLLEKDRNARFPSAQVTLDEIERLRRGETLAPVAGGQRSRLPLVLGGLGLVGALVAGWSMFGGGDAQDPAQAPGRSGSQATTAQASGPGAATDTGSGDGGPESAAQGSGAGADGGNGGAATPVAGAGAGAPSETEFELRAEVALLQLRDRVLSEPDRIAALRALATEFAGTDTAQRATEAADALVAAREEADLREAEKRARSGAVLAALRVAAQLDATPFGPGLALREMHKVEGLTDPEFTDQPAFVAGRDALVLEVLNLGLSEARASLAAADEAANHGDLDGMAARLREVRPLGDLPDPAELAALGFDPTAPPEAYTTLKALVDLANERLSGIGARREELARVAAANARRAAAEALGGGHGLEHDLRVLDLEGAAARLDAARSALAPSEGRDAALGALATDLRHARGLLTTYGEGFSGPGWKRRSFTDPRATGTRTVSAEALGADADGVLVDGGGKSERIPWSAWANQPRALESLINGRLERELNDDERRGAATLLRIAAVLQALDEAQEILVADSTAKFSPGEAEALLAGYTTARDWAASNNCPGMVDALAAETQAAETLAAALRARTEEQWSLAATALERLLQDYSETLLVLLLSDGNAN